MDPKFLSAAVCLFTIFGFCLGLDTLSANRTLADGEVLVSRGQRFELGFFSPGKSTSKFLGIWYKATPDIVIWVANRNSPIMDSNGVLTLSENGTLILSTSPSENMWLFSPLKPASRPVLQLLRTGKLVLSDNSSKIWQSCDYPSDSGLPEMSLVHDLDTGESMNLTSWRSADDPSTGEYNFRIDNKGLSQLVLRKGMEKIFRIVFWNGHFTGIPEASDPAWRTDVVSHRGRLISSSRPFDETVSTRWTLNHTGLLQLYIMNEQQDGWNHIMSQPRDSCDNYGHCGYNGICRIYKTQVCDCLRGFEPKVGKEWSKFNWESGCTRNLPSDCQKEDGFLKVENVKLPDSVNFRLNPSMNIDECRDECLKNCDCTAYADPYFSNGSSCLMWFGNLIDIREETGEADRGPSVYIRVPISELEHVTDWNEKSKWPAKIEIIFTAVASGFGMFILGSSFGSLLVKARRKKQGGKRTMDELNLPLFDLATITAATNNFSTENKIGEGGFGPVYKGNLSENQEIAVKRMSTTSGQGPQEFKNEVTLIAKLQHRNLIKILGCCIEGEENMLIYDYMQNKSLDYFIFDQERRALLTWPKRFDIIMGIARGLLYLHHDSRLKIIHRDLKTSNILLDENLNAKISDFGIARGFEEDQTAERTKRVIGTCGYMAPEYAFDGKFSIKSDVFSLGVVILEIVSGKKNRGFKDPSIYNNLLEQAWVYCMENRVLELMDPCYNDSWVESQVRRCIQVGLLCVQNVPEYRPMMSSVILMLSSEDIVLPQPTKPGFFLQSSFSLSQRDASESTKYSRCSVTMTDVEAR